MYRVRPAGPPGSKMTCNKKGAGHHPEDDPENSPDYAGPVEEAPDTASGRPGMPEDRLAAATGNTEDRARSNEISGIRGTATGS